MKGTSPFYVNELFVPSKAIYKTRSHMALEIPLRKSNLGQKNISIIRPSIWNKLSNDLNILITVISFTHNYKKLVLKNFITSIITFITIISTKIFIIIIIAIITVITFESFTFSLSLLLLLFLYYHYCYNDKIKNCYYSAE